MISLCPECGFELFGIPHREHPLCQECKADIRRVFTRIVISITPLSFTIANSIIMAEKIMRRIDAMFPARQ